jgi:hypothetical protein
MSMLLLQCEDCADLAEVLLIVCCGRMYFAWYSISDML